MLLGALVTYRRPDQLMTLLEGLARQTKRLDRLVVVDNDHQRSGWIPVQQHLKSASTGAHAQAAEQIDYLPQDENSGAAGGWAVGQSFLLQAAQDSDWIVMLDDDDPPRGDTILEQRQAFAKRMIEEDPRTAAISGVGAVFDQGRGRLRRLADEELQGPVAVDYVGSNHFPLYRAGVMRQLGPFFPGLFLGYTELEYSLRVRRADLNIYIDGDPVRERRTKGGRLGLSTRSKSRIQSDMPPWRVYYTTRNMVWMLRVTGHPVGALRVSVRRGLGRGLSQIVVAPGSAARYLKAGCYGILHGWTDRMGPVIDPEDNQVQIRRDKIEVRSDLALQPLSPAVTDT